MLVRAIRHFSVAVLMCATLINYPLMRLALAPAHAADGPALPAPEQLLILVRTTLIALNQANITRDYSVLHALCAPILQKKVSASDLAASFESLRKRNFDFAAVAILTPHVTEAPTITPNGILAVRGLFETKPQELRFVIGFVLVAGTWRIETLSVTVGPNELKGANKVR